jgi:hypothetical protein
VGLLVASKDVDVVVVLALNRLMEVKELGLQKLILFLGLFDLLVDIAD